MIQFCHSCGASVAGSQQIRLWDGRDYCETCVATASPKLVVAARELPALEASVVFNLGRSAWGLFRNSLGIAFSVYFAASMVAAFIDWLDGRALQNPFISQFSVIALAVALSAEVLAFPSVLLRIYADLPKTIQIMDGVVAVSQKKKRNTSALSECRWFVGRENHEPAGHLCLSSAPAIVIACPPYWRDNRSAYLLGKSEFEVWTAFFQLCIPDRKIVPPSSRYIIVNGALQVLLLSACAYAIGLAIAAVLWKFAQIPGEERIAPSFAFIGAVWALFRYNIYHRLTDRPNTIQVAVGLIAMTTTVGGAVFGDQPLPVELRLLAVLLYSGLGVMLALPLIRSLSTDH